MKKNIVVFSFLFSFLSISLFAQNSADDQELSSVLKDLNINAKANIKLFKKDLSVDFNVSEGKIDQLMLNYDMQPADVYMTLNVSKQSGKTADEVAESFKKNKGKGWGVIAKEMGIKPGSKEFHALKDGAKGKSKKMKEDKGGKGKGGKNREAKGKGKKK